MTADNSIQALIIKIIEKTTQGKMAWKKGAKVNSFSYSMINASIMMHLEDINDATYVFFSVFDETGQVIDFKGELFSWDPNMDQFPLSYLYSIAKRKALKIDETVANISSYLDCL